MATALVSVAVGCLVAGYWLGRTVAADLVTELRGRLAVANAAVNLARRDQETQRVEQETQRVQLVEAEQSLREVLADVRGLADQVREGALPEVSERAVHKILAQHDQGAGR